MFVFACETIFIVIVRYTSLIHLILWKQINWTFLVMNGSAEKPEMGLQSMTLTPYEECTRNTVNDL